MKMFMLPYKKGSKGAKALADALGVPRIKLTESRFRPSADKVILNWGNTTSDIQKRGSAIWLNEPNAVRSAINKIDCLMALSGAGIPCVDMTGNYETAAEWAAQGTDVVLRTQACGSGGEGIHIHTGNTDISIRDHYRAIREFGASTPVKLMTKYFKAKEEYRVHVFDGRVIDVQQKRKREGVEVANFKVRNHANGFVFCREDVNPEQCVLDTSLAAVEALGLDFGAVDIRYNGHYKEACVLEVNTAPGLEGTTLENYVAAVRELISKIGV